MTASREISSVGHSTRALDELVHLLRQAEVEVLLDVRRFPASRRHPHFARGALEESLPAEGIAYLWLGDALGGRRQSILAAADSPNRAWQAEAFRSYADATRTPEFRRGLAELETVAAERRAAFMCAERPWWKCHRRILADLLTVRGWTVIHLLDPGRQSVHQLSEWARFAEGELTYPGPA